jgi:xanthine dehydrogenase molybdenum-binding subunit
VTTVSPERTQAPFDVVGTHTAHADFVEKVKGTLAYADDWQLPGMLHGRVVRAQVPSARILAVDTSEAESVRGVHSIVVAADVPHNVVQEQVSGLGAGVSMPVLAAERIRYAGEPVALVAAESPAAAAEAADRVFVEYEELPGVFEPRGALAPDAPLVHDSGNLLVDWRFEKGDVDGALGASAHVVEGTYSTQRVDHAYLEPEAGIGWIDANGVLTLRVSTQVIEHDRQLAEILGLPQNRVRVSGTFMGGGFGGKEDMTVEPHLALLVWKTRRPVRMVWTRQESLLARQKRHPFSMRYRTGVTADGRILAQEVDIVGDAGAYPLLSERVLFAGGVTACGPYDVANARVRSRAVFTNNVPTSAFRGFGAMQVTFAYESQIERVAEAVGRPAVEIRRLNFLQQGDTLPTHEELDTHVGVGETLDAVLTALGPHPEQSERGKRIGRGIGCNIQPYGRSRFFADRASCWVGVEFDGTVTVRTGATDPGGGQAASLAQIAAEVFGIPAERVSVYIADSALTPLAGGTYATRQLYMSGNAALIASTELRDELTPIAAELLGTSAPLAFRGGRVFAEGGGGGVTLGEVARAAEAQGLMPHRLSTFHAEGGTFDVATATGKTFPDFTYGTHAAEVEVDEETGEVRLLRYVACHDVGRAIDPVRVEGQIQGGAAQGIGYALSEEVEVEEGITTSSLFADYLIPSAADVPDIEAIALEIGAGKGPFGARGIGEPPIGPAPAAVANAIADATGVRLTELPFTPARLLEALRAQDA